jgi:hypothetical protein
MESFFVGKTKTSAKPQPPANHANGRESERRTQSSAERGARAIQSEVSTKHTKHTKGIGSSENLAGNSAHLPGLVKDKVLRSILPLIFVFLVCFVDDLLNRWLIGENKTGGGALLGFQTKGRSKTLPYLNVDDL